MDIIQDNVAQLQNTGAPNPDMCPTKLVPHLLNVRERSAWDALAATFTLRESDVLEVCTFPHWYVPVDDAQRVYIPRHTQTQLCSKDNRRWFDQAPASPQPEPQNTPKLFCKTVRARFSWQDKMYGIYVAHIFERHVAVTALIVGGIGIFVSGDSDARGWSRVAMKENDAQLGNPTMMTVASNGRYRTAGTDRGFVVCWDLLHHVANIGRPILSYAAVTGVAFIVENDITADTNDGDVFWVTHDDPKTLQRLDESGVSTPSTEPHMRDGITEEAQDYAEKSNVVVVGHIGCIAAFVWIVRSLRLTLPTSRAVPGLSSRTSDDASPRPPTSQSLARFLASAKLFHGRQI